MNFTTDELQRVFRALGAPNPDGWAQSQTQEGIPQLHRFLFLAKAWSSIPDERDTAWIGHAIAAAEKRPNDPYAGGGHAMKRMLDAGASEDDITELVRAQLAEFLFGLCYLLSDSADAPDDRFLAPELQETLNRVDWGLYALDENGVPTIPIDGLHESVLETDPMGREVRPKNWNKG